MYINPFVAGVLSTIAAELTVFFVYVMVYVYRESKKK